MYLLDTNACIAVLNDSSPQLLERMRACSPSEIRLCSVVKAELLFGAHNSARVNDNLRVLDAFFSVFRSLPFDDAAAMEYGRVRHDLERRGEPIGANDLMIGAIALAQGETLVTGNIREFSRIIGLQIENWQGS